MIKQNGERAGDDNSYDGAGRELVEFCTGAVLTLLMPTLLYCVAIGQLWPLWVMTCNDALGVTAGLVMFKRVRPEDFPSCVPVARIRKVTRAIVRNGLKKAA